MTRLFYRTLAAWCGVWLLMAIGSADAAETPAAGQSVKLPIFSFIEISELDAIAVWSEEIRLNPKLVGAYLQRGSAYLLKFGSSEWDKAIADFNEAIRLDPVSAKAYRYRAGALGSEIDFSRIGLATDPKREYYCKAIADAGEAIRLDPKYVEAYLVRGAVYQARGDLGEALADFTKAIEFDGKSAGGYTSRAAVYLDCGDFEKAAADFGEAIRLGPHAWIYGRRGHAYEASGDLDKALADYGEAVRLSPEDCTAYQRRADAYVKRARQSKAETAANDLSSAIADYTKALALTLPGDFAKWQRTSLLEKRAVAYRAMGDASKAKADFAEFQRLRGRPSGEEEEQGAAGEDEPPQPDKPSGRPRHNLFGPALLGLGPEDEMRIRFSSSGCFHFQTGELVLAGSSPDRLRTPTDTGPLNPNDWRRLHQLLADYRSGNQPGTSTTREDVAISWFKSKRPAGHERYFDPSGRGQLLQELAGRSWQRPARPAGEKPPIFVTKIYPVAEIVAKPGKLGDGNADLAPLAGVIYGLIRPDLWPPGGGATVEVASSGGGPALVIRQTEDAHKHIERLLAFLRRVARKMDKDRPAVCHERPKTAKTFETLERKVTLDFDRLLLADAAKQLKTQYGLDVRLDDQILDPNPVTLHVRDMSLRSAVALMVGSCRLACTIEDGALLITTAQGALDTPHMLCAYRVDDLVCSDLASGGPGRASVEELVSTIRGECEPFGDAECFVTGDVPLLVVDAWLGCQENVAQILSRLRTFARCAAQKPTTTIAIPLIPSPEDKAATEAIDRALAKKVAYLCIGKPLAEFTGDLAKFAGVSVALGPDCSDDKYRITGAARDDDIRAFLQKTLAERFLTWRIENEAIVIDAYEDSPPMTSVAYLPPAADCEALRETIMACLGTTGSNGFGDSGASCLSLGKTKVLAVFDTETRHTEVSALLTFLEKIAKEAAVGCAAISYELDLGDDLAYGKALKTLRRKVTLDIEKQPLQAVLAEWKESYGLSVEIENERKKAVYVEETEEEKKSREKNNAQLRSAPDRLVTLHVKDVPLRLALTQMLRSLDLDWYENGSGATVVVASPSLGDHRRAMFYCVDDLLAPGSSRPASCHDLQTLVETIQIETLSADVALKDWQRMDGARSIVGLTFGGAKILAVSQTDDMHQRVAALLSRLRAARALRCSQTR